MDTIGWLDRPRLDRFEGGECGDRDVCIFWRWL